MAWLPSTKNPAPDSTAGENEEDDDKASLRSVNGGANRNSGQSLGLDPKTRYVSCTPLLGSDDQVGVWMVVMVENELVTGSLPSRERAIARYYNHNTTAAATQHGEDGINSVPATPTGYRREQQPEEAIGDGDGDGDGGERRNGIGERSQLGSREGEEGKGISGIPGVFENHIVDGQADDLMG